MDGKVADVFETLFPGSKYIVVYAGGMHVHGNFKSLLRALLKCCISISRFYAFVTYACCYSAMLNNEMICDTQCVEGDWDVILNKIVWCIINILCELFIIHN